MFIDLYEPTFRPASARVRVPTGDPSWVARYELWEKLTAGDQRILIIQLRDFFHTEDEANDRNNDLR